MVKETENPDTGIDAQRKNENEIIIPVISEEVVIDRKKAVNATIIIEKKISTDEVTVDFPLSAEEIDIEHIPVNQFVDSYPETRYEDDTIIIPVTKEVVVKRLLLVEEIRVIRKIRSSDHTEKVTLK